MEKLDAGLIHVLFEQRIIEDREAGRVHCGRDQLTYWQLNEKANRLAHYLIGRGLKPNDLVGIMLDRSLEVVVAMLGVLKSGAGYLPIEPDFPPDRINFMLDDSGARLILTARPHAARLDAGNVILLEDLALEGYPADNPAIVLSGAALAYVIYTSGTTGKPKGVMIEHRNALSVILNSKSVFDFRPEDAWTVFHSFCFDFSVWEVWGGLFFGRKLVIVPKEVARDGVAFADLLKEERVSVLSLTPTVFYNNMDFIARAGAESRLSLRYVILGGESVAPARFRPWQARFPGVKIVNGYGVTEAAIFFSFKEITPREIDTNLSNIGRPIPTLTRHVRREDGQPAATGEAGELYIAGQAVGRGYINRESLNREKFVPGAAVGDRAMYRTGDLVRLLPEDEMEYLGRMDGQVKIRGFRIELEEVERNIADFRHVRNAAASVFKAGNGEAYLVAHVVYDPLAAGNDPELATPALFEAALRLHLGQHLPEYMLPAYVLFVDRMPLTNSGKVDKQQLPEPTVKTPVRVKQASSPGEHLVLDLWSQLLGVEKARIGVDDSFFDLGGHSLLLARLSSEMYHQFGTKVPPEVLFGDPTVEKLAGYVAAPNQPDGPGRGNAPLPAPDEQEVTPAQKHFFVRNRLNPREAFPNSAIAYEVQGDLDPQKAEAAFRALIRANESLRTSYYYEGGKVYKRVHDNVGFTLDRVASEETGIDPVLAQLTRPFRFGTAPLFRAYCIQLASGKQYLYLDMPHINSDGVSLEAIVQEFCLRYNHQDPVPPKLQYADFQKHFNAYLRSGQYRADEAFWLETLAGGVPALSLPTRSGVASPSGYAGNSVVLPFPAALAGQLRTELKGLSRFQFLLAAYVLLLHRMTRQSDIAVLMPVHNRNQRGFEKIVGLVANTVLVRVNIDPGATVGDFTRACKNALLQAMAHSNYPFDKLHEKGLEQGYFTARTPLYQTFFNYHNHQREYRCGDARLTLHVTAKHKEPLPLSFDVFDAAEGPVLRALSNAAVYGPAELGLLADSYFNTAGHMLAFREARISDLVTPDAQVV